MESSDTTKKAVQPTITLNNGTQIPQIGFGTFNADEGDNIVEVVKSAILDHGYRHIDTAKIYGNEAKIGEALQECFKAGIKREELYITTKLWHSNGEKADVEATLREQLKNLQLEYVDLYLIHWMVPQIDWAAENPILPQPLHKVWAQLEAVVDLGLTKSIGVSNCQFPQLIDILAFARIKPVMNQIEVHPYFTQQYFVDFIRDKFNVQVTAYSPLGASGWSLKNEDYKNLNLFNEPILKEIAEKNEKTIGQVVLNWHIVHRKNIIIPKTSKVERLSENINVYDFTLTEEEYKQIDGLNKNARFFDPHYFPQG